jgi:hypothetical protein
MQTAQQLASGSGLQASVKRDHLLGDPGVFVVDSRAGESWQRLGHEEMMRRLVSDEEPPPGCAEQNPAARFLIHHMLAATQGKPGIHAFATHDSLITATVAQVMGRRLGTKDWPWYLESAFFWTDDAGVVHAAYRDWHTTHEAPIVGLTEADAIALARREIAATVGLDCSARFFLAGGAFKSLLTGRAPRDLDLWAASDADRAVLRSALLARNAEPLAEQPYTEAFRVGERLVELSMKTAPATLDERLGRFDIGLSAVGVEHRAGDRWRASIHARAVESVQARQVLLLDELPNWRHSLATLVRMKHYAAELGFQVPTSESERIWSIFREQTPTKQQGMIERFRASSRFDSAVLKEASWRSQ